MNDCVHTRSTTCAVSAVGPSSIETDMVHVNNGHDIYMSFHAPSGAVVKGDKVDVTFKYLQRGTT